jgi:methionyl-tRNA formyltransferase
VHIPTIGVATGEKFGGVTAHYMTEQIDAGDIIAQRSFELNGSIIMTCIVKSLKKHLNWFPQLCFLKDKKAISTHRMSFSNLCFQHDREIHHRLDFLQMTARQLHNRIRAGRAYGVFRGKRTNIVRGEVANNNRHVTNEVNIYPGVIIDIDQKGVWIAAQNGQFLIVNELIHRGKCAILQSGLLLTQLKSGNDSSKCIWI